MNTRRQFLQLMFGSAIAAVLVPQLEAFSSGYADGVRSVVEPDPALERVTAQAAWLLFCEIAEARGHHFTVLNDRDYAVGEMLPSSMALRHMFGIDFEWDAQDTRQAGFFLRGLVTQAVQHAQLKGVGVYAQLPLPRTVQVAERAGAVRFVRCWDAIRSQMINRFDFLGASTPENLRQSYRIRGEITKSRLLAERAQRATFREGMQSTPFSVRQKFFSRQS